MTDTLKGRLQTQATRQAEPVLWTSRRSPSLTPDLDTTPRLVFQDGKMAQLRYCVWRKVRIFMKKLVLSLINAWSLVVEIIKFHSNLSFYF